MVRKPRRNRRRASIGTGDIKVVVTALGTVTPLATVTVKTLRSTDSFSKSASRKANRSRKATSSREIDPRPFQLAEAQFEGQLVHDQGLLGSSPMDLAHFQTLVKQNSIARQTAEDQVFIVKQDEGSVKLDQAQIDNQKLNPITRTSFRRSTAASACVWSIPAILCRLLPPWPRGDRPNASDHGEFRGPGGRYSGNHGSDACWAGAQGHGLRPRQCHPPFGSAKLRRSTAGSIQRLAR